MAARLGVSVDDIRAAAIKIVKRGEELTLFAVAEEVECKPPSVYHHVPDGLFGLQEMVHSHCRQWLAAMIHSRIERTPENLLWMLLEMATLHPWLYRFHADEWEHQYDLRSRLPLYWLPLLPVMTHDYARLMLKEIFDAE